MIADHPPLLFFFLFLTKSQRNKVISDKTAKFSLLFFSFFFRRVKNSEFCQCTRAQKIAFVETGLLVYNNHGVARVISIIKDLELWSQFPNAINPSTNCKGGTASTITLLEEREERPATNFVKTSICVWLFCFDERLGFGFWTRTPRVSPCRRPAQSSKAAHRKNHYL